MSASWPPLSATDELPLHQSTQTLRYVASTDPRAFERYWFALQFDDGRGFLVTGIGQYPNLGRTDAYGLLVYDGQLTTVRSWRPLGPDRTNLKVGPVSFELVHAFGAWRLRLQDTGHDLSFDLLWRDTMRSVFSRFTPTASASEADIRLLHDWAGYETFGAAEGTVRIRGTDLAVRQDNSSGSRDHHWGVRNGVGGPGLALPEGNRSHFLQFVAFDDWSIWGNRVLYPTGDARPGAGTVEMLSAALRFDPETRHLVGAVVTNRMPDGRLVTITYEQIGQQVAHLRTAGYTGCNGLGTPDGNQHHGSHGGEGVAGETYDVRDPRTRTLLEGFEDHLMRAERDGHSAIGILECRDPALYDMARAGGVYSVLA